MAKDKRVKKLVKGDLHLCDWKQQEIADHMDILHDIVAEPRFVCAKCARSSAKKRYLCEPILLER